MRDEYRSYQENKLKEFEVSCTRCGSCCGVADNDPCQHLVLGNEGKYSCDIYENRFGLRKSRNGREFICVPIRQILFRSWLGSWKCAYKKALSRQI
ncbi:MAG: hypothetical protein ABH954_01710 [Candidatus Omnitrophota bacterium]